MSSTRQSKWPLFVGNSNGSAVVITLTLMWVVCSTTPMAMATFGACHVSAMNTRPNKVPFHRIREDFLALLSLARIWIIH